MCFSPIPKYSFNKVTEITPSFLEKIGVRFLMLDLDNTLARYSDDLPPEDVVTWAEDMRQGGITLFIVSNNHKETRVEKMSKALGVGFINAAGKPSPKGVLKAMELSGQGREVSALCGDQAYTDVIAANSASVVSIAVRPLDGSNALFTLRFLLEMPFRILCKNKMWKAQKRL